MGGGALALLLTLALPGQTTLDVGARAETRGGLTRAFDSIEPVPTVDARLMPMFAAGTRVRVFELTANYTPDLTLRTTPQAVLPLIFHRGAAQARFLLMRDGPTVDAQLTLSGGDVDFSQAATDLGNPSGLGAAGGVLTLINSNARVDISDTAGRLLWRQTTLLSTVLTPTAYGEALPPTQLLPQTSAEVGWIVTRRDRAFLTARAGLALPHLLALSPRSPRIHPAWVGGAPGARWEHRLTRNTDLRGSIGLLLAWQRTGYIFQQGTAVTYPELDLAVTNRSRFGPGMQLTLSASGFVRPIYDPFLVGLTERAGAQVAGTLALARSISVDAALQGAGLVSLEVPDVSRNAPRDLMFIAGTTRVIWRLHDNLSVESGLGGNVRLSSNNQLNPQGTLYVAVTGGAGLDL